MQEVEKELIRAPITEFPVFKGDEQVGDLLRTWNRMAAVEEVLGADLVDELVALSAVTLPVERLALLRSGLRDRIAELLKCSWVSRR